MFFSALSVLNNKNKTNSIEKTACELGLPVAKSSVGGDATVLIAFAGEMKTGKSTLINALLGAQILPSSALPCTVVIHRLKYAPQASLSFHYKNGTIKEQVAINELTLLTAKNGERSDLAFVTVYSPEIPDGIEIVDTPGFNDPVPDRNALAASMMAEADAIVFVVDASQALKSSELPFIEQFLFNGSRKKTILCVNMVDSLNEVELNEVRERLSKEISTPSSPISGQPVFFVSGKQALKRKSVDSAYLLDFDALSVRIQEFSKMKPLLEKRRTLLYFRDTALAKKRALDSIMLSPDEQRKAIEGIIARIDLVKNGVNKVLEGWVLLTAEIDTLIKGRFIEFNTEIVSTCNANASAGEYVEQKFNIRKREVIEQITAEIKYLVADKFASEISLYLESISDGKMTVSKGSGDFNNNAINSHFDEKQAMMVSSILPMGLSVVFGPVGLLAGLVAGYIAYNKVVSSQKKAVTDSIDILIRNVTEATKNLEVKLNDSLTLALKQTSDVIEASFMAKIESIEFEVVALGAEKWSPQQTKQMVKGLAKFISEVEHQLEDSI
jgi:GTPase SAR1 family protein